MALQKTARVVVIGGGVIGCSVLYHLTKLGWTDVLLLERKELTAGSTWHAAGGFHSVNGNANLSRLQAYTCGIYAELQALSDQDVGAHYVGGLLVAASRERWNSLLAEHTRHRVLGLESELIGPEEIKRLVPIMDVSEVIGAIWDPTEGYVDPSSATNAYAMAARNAGATIQRRVKVEDLRRTPSGEWEVVTNAGSIIAEHVVNAAGLWAREVGRMAGVKLPLIPMEHHYLITDDLPELADQATEMPAVADLDGGLYMRQERRGVLLGVYEREATPWAINGTPWDYAEDELLVPDLDRISDDLERGFRRFPAIARAGIKRIINGPFTFTPDGNPLVGPIANVPNYWIACGVMAGFAQGGGVGRTLAEWIVQGQPTIDVFGMDVARFDPELPDRVVIARAREFYGRRFDVPFPNETWPAGRPFRTSPLYCEHKARGATFVSSFGYEVPAYFGSGGRAVQETPSFGRTEAFEIVAQECRAVRSSVGVADISASAKFRVAGSEAAALIAKVVASVVPAIGHSGRGLLLNDRGMLLATVDVLHLATDEFMLIGASFLQALLARWLASNSTGFAVSVENLSHELGGLLIAGPDAGVVLDRLVQTPGTGATLGEGQVGQDVVGFAPCRIIPSCRTGETGFEFYTELTFLNGLYGEVISAGADCGIADVGYRALESLGMEHAPGANLREISQDHSVAECGYGAMLDSGRSDYIGCIAAAASLAVGAARTLVGLRVDAGDSDPAGEEPVWLDDVYVGYTSSGTYGHSIGYPIAMAFVDALALANPTRLKVTVLGQKHAAQIVPTPFLKA